MCRVGKFMACAAGERWRFLPSRRENVGAGILSGVSGNFFGCIEWISSIAPVSTCLRYFF